MTGLPQPPTPPPPLSAEFENSSNSGSQGASTQNWNMARGSSGQSAVGYGNKTVITNPNEQQVITLDHIKKEATVMPLPQMPAGMGGMIPGAPKAPLPQPSSPTPPVQVTDLGKKLIAGHEAVGKLFTFKPPAPPQLPKLPGVNLPQMPKVPGGPPAPPAPPSASATPPQSPGGTLPQLPGGALPQLPGGIPAQSPGGAPAAPSAATPAAPKTGLPQMPHSVEVWTSHKLQLPLLTKSGSGASQQTTTCKQVTPGEPPTSAFQIPPGYKVIHPPSIPHLPSIPKVPSMPKLAIPKPSIPKLPGV